MRALLFMTVLPQVNMGSRGGVIEIAQADILAA